MGIKRFRLGMVCKTQGGKTVTAMKAYNNYRGYETMLWSDGKHRYNRSTHEECQGRCTGRNWEDHHNIDPICIGIDRSKFDETVQDHRDDQGRQ